MPSIHDSDGRPIYSWTNIPNDFVFGDTVTHPNIPTEGLIYHFYPTSGDEIEIDDGRPKNYGEEDD